MTTASPLARKRYRPPALPFPELAEIPFDAASRREFWRTCFLRQLAEYRAGEELINSFPPLKKYDSTRYFLFGAFRKLEGSLTQSLSTWLDTIGGLAPALEAQP